MTVPQPLRTQPWEALKGSIPCPQHRPRNKSDKIRRMGIRDELNQLRSSREPVVGSDRVPWPSVPPGVAGSSPESAASSPRCLLRSRLCWLTARAQGADADTRDRHLQAPWEPVSQSSCVQPGRHAVPLLPWTPDTPRARCAARTALTSFPAQSSLSLTGWQKENLL